MATTTTAAASSSDPVSSPNPKPHLFRPLKPPSAASRGGFPPRSAAVAAADRVVTRVVTVVNTAGYIRNSSPTAVMIHSHSTPAGHPMRPPVASSPQPHHFFVSRQIARGGAGAHRAVPVVATVLQPKVTPFPTVSSAPENSLNNRDRREDTVMVLHDRKVRLSESSSGSLYPLCRSWVRNGLPQETQPLVGDGLKLLPKPLPALVTDLHIQQNNEDSPEDENSDKEDADAVKHLSSQDLLKRHVKRAKRVRERLRKERFLKIERYKHRLALLLSTQSEVIGRNEVTPRN